AYLVGLVAAFLVIKQYAFLKAVAPPALFHDEIRIIGFSYMLFRQIHLAVDAFQGQVGHISLWSYLNYQLNPFGLLAGPIQRYQEFEPCWTALEPVAVDRHEVLTTWLR